MAKAVSLVTITPTTSSTLLLVTLPLLLLLLGSPTLATAAPPVLDTDGDPLVTGQAYYVVPREANPIVAGAWRVLHEVFGVGPDSCSRPSHVAVGPSGVPPSDGGVFFRPAGPEPALPGREIGLGSHLNAYFDPSKPLPFIYCRENTLWQVSQGKHLTIRGDFTDPTTTTFAIGPGPEGGPSSYQIMWCPAPGDPQSCVPVGLDPESYQGWLAAPQVAFPVRFFKSRMPTAAAAAATQ